MNVLHFLCFLKFHCMKYILCLKANTQSAVKKTLLCTYVQHLVWFERNRSLMSSAIEIVINGK